MKKVGLYVMSLFYFLAGLNHFRAPEFYRPIMPPIFPAPDLLIMLSGVAEAGLGVLLLFPRTRRLAAWGVIALLIAVFPANIYMWMLGGEAFGVPDWVLVARLPLQFAFMGWAYIYTRVDKN